MKVTVKLSIEVDPARWDEVFGTGTSSKAVVDDVRRYVRNTIQSSPAVEDTDADVTIGR